MAHHPLESLLSRLDIRVQAVALCAIGRGYRLRSEPADTVVIHYVLSGEGWIETDGGAAQPFGANSILIVPRHCGKRIGPARGEGVDVHPATHCTQAEDGLLQVDIMSDGEPMIMLACASVSADCAGSFGLFDGLVEPLVEDVSGAETARAAFALLLDESASPKFGSRALIATLVKQELILAMRRHVEHHGTNSPLFAGVGDPRLMRATAAVIAAPGAPHSVEDLAALVGMSRSTFIKKFSDAFSRSPMEFVATARLEAAARLLLATPIQPVKAVASAVGFASRSHFSRAFRARYGVAPAAYRSAGSDDVHQRLLACIGGDHTAA